MFSTVANSIRTRYSGITATPTQYDNGPTVVTTGIWARHSILWGSITATEIRGNMRLIGVILIQLRQPVAQGEHGLLSLADTLANAFRSIKVSNVTYRTPTVESFGRDGPYWLVNVHCPFFSDEVV